MPCWQHPHTHGQLIDKAHVAITKVQVLGRSRFWYRPGASLEPEIDKQTLFTTEIALYCHPDYRLHKNGCWEEIQSEELTPLATNPFSDDPATAGVRIKPKMTVKHMATAMSLAAQV